jgi:DNA-binding MarR family transcriptional regulator
MPVSPDASAAQDARAAQLARAAQDALAARAARAAQSPATAAPRRRGRPFESRRIAEQALIYEIRHTARRIAEARDPNGQPIYRTDGVFRVLDAVARAPYCMAIADLGRVLRIRKQSAQQFAHAAAREGVIDLEPNRDDKRLLQLFMTPKGRRVLKDARRIESDWLMLLLHGLGDRELEAATHVILVIRQRLARDAREWRKRKRTMTSSP